MTRPAMINKGHAFIIIVGGEYRGTVLDGSIIHSVDIYGTGRNAFVQIVSVEHRNVPHRNGWNWAQDHIKWVSEFKFENEALYDDGLYNVGAKVRQAVRKFDGAWVVRLGAPR